MLLPGLISKTPGASHSPTLSDPPCRPTNWKHRRRRKHIGGGITNPSLTTNDYHLARPGSVISIRNADASLGSEDPCSEHSARGTSLSDPKTTRPTQVQVQSRRRRSLLCLQHSSTIDATPRTVPRLQQHIVPSSYSPVLIWVLSLPEIDALQHAPSLRLPQCRPTVCCVHSTSNCCERALH